MSQSRDNNMMCNIWATSTEMQVHRDQLDIGYLLCIEEEKCKIKSSRLDLIDPVATIQKYQKFTVMDLLL